MVLALYGQNSYKLRLTSQESISTGIYCRMQSFSKTLGADQAGLAMALPEFLIFYSK